MSVITPQVTSPSSVGATLSPSSYSVQASVEDSIGTSLTNSDVSVTSLSPQFVSSSVVTTTVNVSAPSSSISVSVSVAGSIGSGDTLPVVDTQTIVKGSADSTKLLRFEIDGFTSGVTRVLTPPNANATIAGLEVENVFTTGQQITVATATQTGLTIQTTDNSETNPAWRLKSAAGTVIASLEADGILKLNHGLSLPAFDAIGFIDYAIKIVRQSGAELATGIYFQNKRDDAYTEMALMNDIEAYAAFGIGGSSNDFDYDNVAYFFATSNVRLMRFELYETGQYFLWQTFIGETMRLSQTALTLANAINIALGTGTGTKIGTATSQKLGFWNATPIVQPTTGVAAATFVANAGTAVNDASTFDGYTLKQVVKALRNEGLLA